MSDDVKVPRLLTTAQLAKLINIPAWRILQLVKGRPDKRSKKAKPLPGIGGRKAPKQKRGSGIPGGVRKLTNV